jgi:hypothetical protein
MCAVILLYELVIILAIGLLAELGFLGVKILARMTTPFLKGLNSRFFNFRNIILFILFNIFNLYNRNNIKIILYIYIYG